MKESQKHFAEQKNENDMVPFMRGSREEAKATCGRNGRREYPRKRRLTEKCLRNHGNFLYLLLSGGCVGVMYLLKFIKSYT
jgi:hypothetical protein